MSRDPGKTSANMADSELKCCNCLNPYQLTGMLQVYHLVETCVFDMFLVFIEGDRSKKTGRRNCRLPLLLQCGHTFCSQCLPKFSPQATTTIQCPLCKVKLTMSTLSFPPLYGLEALGSHVNGDSKTRLRKCIIISWIMLLKRITM